MQERAEIDWELMATKFANDLIEADGDNRLISLVVSAYLDHAYEKNLSPEKTRDLLGISAGCILDQAAFSARHEDAVIDAYARLEPLKATRRLRDK